MAQPKAPLTLFGHDIVGPTASKPASPDIGQHYFDTDLNHWVVWNGTQWQNSAKVGSSNAGLTAHAGGGQASATPLTSMYTEVTVVASSGDSVLLPASIAGTCVMTANAGANPMNVFPAGTEQINALGASQPFSVANAKRTLFFCPVAGQWYSILTA